MGVSILSGLLLVGTSVAFATDKPGLPDRSSAPIHPSSLLETVATLELPPGNVTVSPEGRVFITFFPGANPPVKVAEIVDGHAVPYPSQDFQDKDPLHFQMVLSIRADRQNRLWALDAGNYGSGTPRLISFDLATGLVLSHFEFPKSAAPLGSFLNDFVLSSDGKTVLITDSSNLAHRPALVILDLATGVTRRVLENDASTRDGNYDVFVDGKRIRFFGIMPLQFGVDGIAMDAEERWLYFNALNSGNLHRVAIRDLLDPTLPESELSARVEKVADITANDGLLVDRDGGILVTDPEHYALNKVTPEGKFITLFKDPKLRWPDGLAHAPDGHTYLTCSSIQDVLPWPIQSAIRRKGPYHVFRFKLP